MARKRASKSGEGTDGIAIHDSVKSNSLLSSFSHREIQQISRLGAQVTRAIWLITCVHTVETILIFFKFVVKLASWSTLLWAQWSSINKSFSNSSHMIYRLCDQPLGSSVEMTYERSNYTEKENLNNRSNLNFTLSFQIHLSTGHKEGDTTTRRRPL